MPWVLRFSLSFSGKLIHLHTDLNEVELGSEVLVGDSSLRMDAFPSAVPTEVQECRLRQRPVRAIGAEPVLCACEQRAFSGQHFLNDLYLM